MYVPHEKNVFPYKMNDNSIRSGRVRIGLGSLSLEHLLATLEKSK